METIHAVDLQARHGQLLTEEPHLGRVRRDDGDVPGCRTSASLKFHGYGISLSLRGGQKRTAVVGGGSDYRTIPIARRHERWVVRVVINQDHYRLLHAELLGMATHRSADYLKMKFYNLPFSPYAPIRAQLLALLRQVNKARRHVGYAPVPSECIRFHRKMTSPYKPVHDEVLRSRTAADTPSAPAEVTNHDDRPSHCQHDQTTVPDVGKQCRCVVGGFRE